MAPRVAAAAAARQRQALLAAATAAAVAPVRAAGGSATSAARDALAPSAAAVAAAAKGPLARGASPRICSLFLQQTCHAGMMQQKAEKHGQHVLWRQLHGSAAGPVMAAADGGGVSLSTSDVEGVRDDVEAAVVVVDSDSSTDASLSSSESSSAAAGSVVDEAALREEALGPVPDIVAALPSVKRRSPGHGEVFASRVRVRGQEDEIVLETGKLAQLASGAVVASVGDTKVLVTAVASSQLDPSRDFLPLMVDYREKQFAVGRIPNTFMRREGAPKEREILCSRVIDRSIRPLFPKGFYYDTQVMASVLCSDQEQDPDVLAINAASAAISISDIPWHGPVGAVRVGRINGTLVVNPSMNQLVESDLNLVYAGTEDKAVMIEMQGRELSNDDLAKALKLAHEEAVKMIAPQKQLAAMVQQPKREARSLTVSHAVMDRVRALAASAVTSVLTDPSYSKQDRGVSLSKVEAEVAATFAEHPEWWADDGTDSSGHSGGGGEGLGTKAALQQLPAAMEKLKREVIREGIFSTGTRVDGRGLDEVRRISCETSVLPPLYGSSLFSRGNTQVLCTVTLGPPDDAQRLDSLVGPSQKRFMVHYSFPPFSINEVRQERGGLNRREVGHGTLAEKALVASLPDEEDYPFSIRLNSEVLGSDGSTSMATVCGGSLALMDAGIGLEQHVAGISMGLITHRDDATGAITDYRLLTDILGLEDYLGDMDFKIAGTRGGVTAIQLDIKLPGVPLPIVLEALAPAHRARCQILDAMEAHLPVPRLEPRSESPRAGTMTIERESIGRLIGPQGSVVKGIEKNSGTRLSVADDGTVCIFARDRESFDAAKEMVEGVVGSGPLEVGATYEGTVVGLRDYGAIVDVDGGRMGLLHISELEHHRVTRVDDVVRVGDKVKVTCLSRDARGNVKLSRKALLPPPPPGIGGVLSSSPTAASSPSYRPAAQPPAPAPAAPAVQPPQPPSPVSAQPFPHSYQQQQQQQQQQQPQSPQPWSVPELRGGSSGGSWLKFVERDSSDSGQNHQRLPASPPPTGRGPRGPSPTGIGAGGGGVRTSSSRRAGPGGEGGVVSGDIGESQFRQRRAVGEDRSRLVRRESRPPTLGGGAIRSRGEGGGVENSGVFRGTGVAREPWSAARGEGARLGVRVSGERAREGMTPSITPSSPSAATSGVQERGVAVGQQYSVRIKDVRELGARVETEKGMEGILLYPPSGSGHQALDWPGALAAVDIGSTHLTVTCTESADGLRPKFQLTDASAAAIAAAARKQNPT